MAHTVSSRALCTLDDVRDYYEWEGDEHRERDPALVMLINSVSREMHKVAGREFVSYQDGEATRIFEVPHSHARRVRSIFIDDCASITTVEALLSLWDDNDATDITSDVKGFPMNREPWQPITWLRVWKNFIPGEAIRVTGTWGFPEVPEDIKQATVEAVHALAQRDLDRFTDQLITADANPSRINTALPTFAFQTAIAYQRMGGV